VSGVSLGQAIIAAASAAGTGRSHRPFYAQVHLQPRHSVATVRRGVIFYQLEDYRLLSSSQPLEQFYRELRMDLFRCVLFERA